MVKKLLRAENGISHIQSSSAKSSTLLLTFPGRGGTTPKEKEEESAGGEQQRKKHTVGISHQSWPDFFLLLSSLCPSWRRVKLLPFFVSFFQKLFDVGRLLPFQDVLGTTGRNARRHRDAVSGLYNWTANKLSRVK